MSTRDASDTTRRRKQRTLFADRIVQETTMQKGWKNHIRLEGGSADVGAMTYPPFYSMVGGTLQTSVAERDSYKASVPNTQPDAPTSVSAVAVGTSGATVSFAAPAYTGKSPITSYTVISSPGGIRVTGGSSPISITGLNSQYTYTFTVIARNAEGNSPESELSNVITLVTVPSSPRNVVATRGNVGGQAIISFDAPLSDGGDTITSYIVTTSPGNTTTSGSSSPITISGLTNGTSYTFTIVAKNSVGDSESATSNSVIPATVPSAPVIQSIVPGNGQVTITMQPCNIVRICGGGLPITSYTATSSPGGITTSGSSPLIITGLTNGTAYTFSVTATNAVGNSAETISASVTPVNTSLPSPPIALSGVGGDKAIYVLFTAGANGGSPITNYEYSIDDGETFTAFNPPQASSPVEIHGNLLTNGSSYMVKLKAVTANGVSTESVSVTVTPAVNTLLSSTRLIRLEAYDSNSYSGSGTTWTNLDSSGSYSASLLNGPSFDATNKYFSFDGVDQIAQIPDSAAIQPSVGSGLTILVWAKVSADSEGGIISKQYGQSPGGYDGYSLSIGGNNSMYLKMNGRSINDTYSSANNVLNRDVWRMYTIVVYFGGGTTNPSKVYINTKNIINSVNTNPYTGNNESGIPFPTAPLQFPRGIQEYSNYGKADIRAIYYYNTALSHEDIIKNYDTNRSLYELI